MRIRLLVTAALLATALIPNAAAAGGSKPEIIPPVLPRLNVADVAPAFVGPVEGEPRHGITVNVKPRPGAEGDAIPQTRDGVSDARTLNQLSDPIVAFDAMSGSNPNDTVGDVGPDHFVQAINSRVTVYDKLGNVVAGPRNLGQFWNNGDATVDACERDAGDPVVLYDNLADRWFIAQFSRFAPFANQVCIAISVTADPNWASGYYSYVFDVGEFPDYLKFGAWTDGYYMSANGGSTALMAVFDRANMLNGQPAGGIKFTGIPDLPNNSFNVLMPSDIDGSTPPPAGTPGYFYRPVDGDSTDGGADRVELFSIAMNWAAPASSTVTGPTSIPLLGFDQTVCGYLSFGCVPQPGNSGVLDPVNETGMFRFPYRNYGGRQVLAGNFTVDVDGSDNAGIRWFVLENTGAGWGVADQGTYAPQPTGATAFVHRFMGSIAMDRDGNLALGYTRSSGAQPPGYTGFASAVYTGRLATDVPGLLPQPEIAIRNGTGALGTNGALMRWGDYYAMVVDPVDDCTFWYTGDYATNTRQSVIASFRFDTCATDLRITKSVSPSHPNAGEEAVYTINVYNDGHIVASNTVVSDTLPPEVAYLANTDSCTGPPIGATGTLTCPLGDLAPGASKSFQVKVRIGADLGGATSITNTASVSSDSGESDPADNSVSLTHLVNEAADLSVTKLCKPDTNPATAGTTGICTILVTNNGPSAARAVTVTDTHRSEGSFTLLGAVASQGACAVGATSVSCSLGTVSAGATVIIDISLTSPSGIDVNDVARVSSPTPDPFAGNNEAAAGLSFSASADVSVTKTGPASVLLGDTFTYTLSVDNAGPSDATSVVVIDPLPAGIEFISAVASVGSFTAVGNTITWNLGNVAVADPIRTLHVTVRVLPQAPASLVNNASVSSATADPNTANNLTTLTTQVTGTDLWIEKTGTAPAGNPAGALVYRITVHNHAGSAADSTPTSGWGGPNDAQDVVVVDSLPLDTKKLTVQFLTPGCAYSATTHKVTCTAPTVASGTSVTFEIQVQIKGSVGTVTNSATVSSSTPDPVAGNNKDSVNNVVQGSTGRVKRP